VQFLPRILLVLLLAATLRAGDPLAHARQAQAMLGPETWTQIIRVENTARFGRYPRIVFALVFELADILWFYTDADGTQSFSLHQGRLAEEKADFGPLLRDIDPGFAHWSVVTNDVPATAKSGGELPNGCLIKSVAALRSRLARGGAVARPSLLSFYVDTPGGRRGHTVLTYEAGGHLEVIDPEQPTRIQRFATALEGDALALARTLSGNRIVAARWVPMGLSVQQGGPALAAAHATPTPVQAM
jgi:hypothetical protein